MDDLDPVPGCLLSQVSHEVALGADGKAQEKVYDVVWSDDRKPDPTTGKLPPVGNTVNVGNASYENSIGANELSAVWTDPDFKPEHHAVYYTRVIEISTPRWSKTRRSGSSTRARPTPDASRRARREPRSRPVRGVTRAGSS